MSARERAERRLVPGGRRNPEWMQGDALKGIGWALLDLADAIREHAPKPVLPSALERLAEGVLDGRAAFYTNGPEQTATWFVAVDPPRDTPSGQNPPPQS